MRAFFVRPFGTKEGIDFEQVEAVLIRPALEQLRRRYGLAIEGGTTGEFIRQGNIREDMFRLLVTADLVIADVSIYNANAFYELGIRHGLRHQHTFLIREKSTAAKYPFDLQTDRYFIYDGADLASAVDGLAAALRSTLNADPRFRDSPVFQLLPNLKPHDRAVLMPVPLGFQEAVKLAQAGGKRGDLRLLAYEAQGFEWESEGLRLVGDAQFKLKAFPGAKETFEALQRANPSDVRANLRLGTIYQKLAATASEADTQDLLTRSDQAIDRALGSASAPAERAEAFSLRGSNAKTRWLADWRDKAADARGGAALGSGHLAGALDSYLGAYAENLSSYYPGANALALLKIQRLLAQRDRDTWDAGFDDSDKAGDALGDREACEKRIAAALHLVLGTDTVLKVKQDEGDNWAALTRADVMFLTADKPKRVEQYRKALARITDDPFSISATRRNIEIFETLGLLAENVTAALGVIDKALAAAGKIPAAQERLARVVLFAGHMVDRPDRAPDKARFPRTPEAEAKARAMIEEALRAESTQPRGVSLGIAGGTCGSDILFHEVCGALGIPTQLYLALPQTQFQVESVQHGGPGGWSATGCCASGATASVAGGQVAPAMARRQTRLRRLAAQQPLDDVQCAGTRLSARPVALYNREREADGPGGTGHLV